MKDGKRILSTPFSVAGIYEKWNKEKTRKRATTKGQVKIVQTTSVITSGARSFIVLVGELYRLQIQTTE